MTTAAFYDEYLSYVKLILQALLLQLLFVDNGPSLLVQAYGFMRLCEGLDEIGPPACHFDWFFAQTTTEFYGRLANYCAASLVVMVIDFAEGSGWIRCSASGGES